jgi:hypothetical protein
LRVHDLPTLRRRIAVLAGALSGATALAVAPAATAVTATTDLTTLTAAQVAAALVGPGVTVSNVTYTGSPSAGGTFSGGVTSIGFDAGVMLASGAIANAVGPNTVDSQTSSFATPGDADLNALAGVPTNDAAVLEFDFVPNGDTVFFQYVFGSEEYNEYVNSPFNDTFAFFVNGVNCAVVDTGSGPAPVSVNTINNGNPGGNPTATNPTLYRNNDLSDGGGSINTEYDGLTVVLTCMSPVSSGGTNRLKLAIADGSDSILDSGVFIKQGSLSTTPPTGTGKVTGGGKLALTGGMATLGTTVIFDAQGPRGNLQVNDHRTGDKFHGYDVDSLIVDTATNTATWSGDGRWNGEDGYAYQVVVIDNRNGNSAKKGSPDTISVVIADSDGNVVWTTGGPIDLTEGNITVHS